MGDWKKRGVDRKDFRNGKSDYTETQKCRKKSSKKPWLIQTRFTGRWVETHHVVYGGLREETLYDDDVSDWHKDRYRREWRNEKRFAKESDAINCWEDSKKEGKFNLLRCFREEKGWEYRIIHEQDYKEEKKNDEEK